MSFWDRELSLPKSLEDYIEARNKSAKNISDLFFMMKKADDELNDLGWDISLPINLTNKYHHIPAHEEKSIKELDRRFWRKCFDMTGLMRIMDTEEKDKFFDSLEKDVPEFTIDNINSTYANLLQSAEKMFSRGIVNVFSRLCGDYKTHSKNPFKIGEKIIMSYMLHSYNNILSSSYSANYSRLSDMDRVFKVLGGEKSNPRDLEFSINRAFKDGNNIYEDEYYYIKGFKNGNLHIKFKRLDLVEEANKLIGKYFNGNALAGKN